MGPPNGDVDTVGAAACTQRIIRIVDGMTSTVSTPSPVPELVGLAAADAHDAALDAGLLAIPQNAAHTGAGRSTVTHQKPSTGEELPRGGRILIWVDDPHGGPAPEGPDDDGPGGGGGGSPLPTSPSPLPSAGQG
jgi:hypothetical protein